MRFINKESHEYKNHHRVLGTCREPQEFDLIIECVDLLQLFIQILLFKMISSSGPNLNELAVLEAALSRWVGRAPRL